MTFCPWWAKEGQNEGTLANHLWTTHYDLSLIRAYCLNYFMTSAETVHWHAHLCKPMTGGNDQDDREEKEYEDDDNGDKDDEFMFEED